MLPLPVVKSIYIYKKAVDMRKSFDGLFAVASQELRISPMNGDLFAFFNKKRTIVKLLFWDTGGLCIIAKRLEKGTFQIPLSVTDKVEISSTNLQLILEGINLESISYRRRFKGLS